MNSAPPKSKVPHLDCITVSAEPSVHSPVLNCQLFTQLMIFDVCSNNTECLPSNPRGSVRSQGLVVKPVNFLS